VGLFQPRIVLKQTKKGEKVPRSQENEVRRVIFCDNAYSVNNNQAENRRLKNRALKNEKNRNRQKLVFSQCAFLGGTFTLIFLSIRSRSTFLM
jgi:hypothetical protein